MRVEAAARARWARSAPAVMLPASTTWRNRLRSVRSNRMLRASRFTKESYAKNLLCASWPGAIFAIDEGVQGRRWPGVRRPPARARQPRWKRHGLRRAATLVRNGCTRSAAQLERQRHTGEHTGENNG